MKKMVICLIFLTVLVTGCGVSQNDYDDLEERVRELEKIHGIGEKQTEEKKNVTQNVKYDNSKNEIYDLSSMSAAEIVSEIDRLYSVGFTNRMPEAVINLLNFPVTPQIKGDSSLFSGRDLEVISFGSSQLDNPIDRISSIEFYYKKNMDGTFMNRLSTRFYIVICEYDKASELDKRRSEKYLAHATENNMAGDFWHAYSFEDGVNHSIQMNGSASNRFSFVLELQHKEN